MPSPQKKVDMIAVPTHIKSHQGPKLKPGNSLTPQKSRKKLMKDMFDDIFEQMQKLRIEMTSISNKALHNREKFKKVQDQCSTTVDQMDDLVTDIKIKAKCIKEDQEDLEDKLTEQIKHLGTASSAGHHRLWMHLKSNRRKYNKT